MRNKTIKFYTGRNPDGSWKECEVCGICSFSHLHRPNTLPKDFEKIPENSQKKDCHCKEDWYEPEKCKNGICGASHCENCSKIGNSENSQEKVIKFTLNGKETIIPNWKREKI